MGPVCVAGRSWAECLFQVFVDLFGRGLQVEAIINYHHLDLTVDCGHVPYKVLDRGRELSLAEPSEPLDDIVGRQAN